MTSLPSQTSAQVLGGEKAGAIPFFVSEDSDMSYNPEVATALGLNIPEAYAGGTDVTK